MFDFDAFLSGATAFLLAFGTALAFLIAFQFVYQLVTPHDERKLIREGNVAAAVAFGGALIGYALPVASAMTQAHSLGEFAAWAALAGLIQIVAFWIVRRIVVSDVSHRIERGELPIALWMGAISIAIGLINAASMTD